MSSNKFKGVFFDAGNTLLRVHPSVGEIYSQAAAVFGANIAPEQIEASFKDLWARTGPLVDNEGHRLSYEKERDWWKFLVREVFDRHIEFKDFEAFFDYLYVRFAEADCWRLYEDVPEVLESLKSKRIKMAIISNWDSRLPSLCEKLAIDSYFETMVISSIVGYEKPHPSIFRIALERTGLEPGEVLYIGDDPYLDYQAAKKVGITALHLDRYGRFPDHENKITSLRELAVRLGL